MYTKGNTIYADAFKYLKHKRANIIALSIQGSADDFEELPMNDPLDVTVEDGRVFFNGRKFLTIPKEITKEGVKTSIIKSRYSNDDQIAIILNKDESDEKRMLFDKMQEWREFAAYVAKNII